MSIFPKQLILRELLLASLLVAHVSGSVELTDTANFNTGFEASEAYPSGYLLSDSIWDVSGDPLPLLDAFGANSTQGIELGLSSRMSVDFTSGLTPPVGWIDLYVKPVFADSDALPVSFDFGQAAVSGFVAVGSDGEVYVLHGDGLGNGVWMASGYTVALDGAMALDWLRMTYRMDYAAQRWDLYLDSQLQVIDLGFIDANAPPLSGFSIEGSGLGATYFDQFSAGFYNPLFTDTDNDGIADAYETAEGLDVTQDDRDADLDADALSNVYEYMAGLSAGNADTDNDGVPDGAEYAAGADPLLADAYELHDLPYFEDFESMPLGSVAGQFAWQSTVGGALVQNATVFAGSQALALESGVTGLELSNAFNGSNISELWIDFNIQPIRFRADVEASVDLSSVASATVFYFVEGGQVVAFDGSGDGTGVWNTYLHIPSAVGWERVTVFKNYAEQTFDLWINDRLVAQGLGFAWTQPYLNRLSFSQGADAADFAYLDDLWIDFEQPAPLDSDGDGLYNIQEDANLNGVVDLGETDPLLGDSDGNSILDSLEVTWLADPAIDSVSVALQADGSHSLSIGFEAGEGFAPGQLGGQQGWEASRTFSVVGSAGASGSVNALSSGAHPSEGAYAYAKRYVEAAGESIVWVSFMAKLHSIDLDAVDLAGSDASAVFALAASNSIAVYDHSNQEWIQEHVDLLAGEWTRYDIQLDYSGKVWSLCVDGSLVFHDVPFVDATRSSLSYFAMLKEGGAGGQSWIDEILISDRTADALDFDGDGLVNSVERLFGSDPLQFDTDDDGMDDAWEYTYGLDPNLDDALDDLDGDHYPNYVEYVRSTDPVDDDEDLDGILDGESQAGTVVMEHWDHSSNRARFGELTYVEDGVQQESIILDNLLWDPAWVTYDHAYGYRIRGYIEAPETATYTFWTYGDDFVELWLSASASKTQVERLASNHRWNFLGDYQQYAGQSSLPVELVAGERYYFEVFHHGNVYNDKFGIAWQYGDIAVPEVISASALSSYVFDIDDLDDDSLDDALELQYGLDPLVGTGSDGRFGDPDNDGFKNWWELWMGTDPMLANDFPEKSRQALFPSLLEPDLLSLSTWALYQSGDHYQVEAFEDADSVYLAGCGNKSSQYVYAYQTVDTPFRLTTKVTYSSVDDTRAQAGLMVSASLDSSAAYYRMTCAPDGRVVSEVRSAEDAQNSTLGYGQPSPHEAVWLRLDYDGSTVTSYYSYDHSQWLQLDELAVDAGEVPFIGFTVSSFDSLEVAAVSFQEVRLDLDSDSDGLWDEQEALLGTNPELADTDGDGYEDAYEVYQLDTDPLVADTWSAGDPIVTQGQSATPLEGSWRIEGDSLYALDYRGTLEFPLSVPADGFYRLEVVVREANAYRGQSAFELKAGIGAVSYGTQAGEATHEASTTLSYWLPWTLAGSKQLALEWVNVQSGSSLQVDRVELIPLVFDTDEAQQTWEADRLTGDFEVEGDTLTSVTSPWNLYGTARDLDLLQIAADSTADSIVAQRALSDTFHADVPLEPIASATQVDVTYANGQLVDQQLVQWSLTNLAETPVEPLQVRRNDSLLLAWRDASGSESTSGVLIEVFKVADFEQQLPADTAQQSYYTLAANGDASVLADFLAAGLSDPFDATLAAVHEYQSGSLRAFTNVDRAYVSLASAPDDSVLLVDTFGLGAGEVATLALSAYGNYVIRASWTDVAGLTFESVLSVDVPVVELGADLSVTTGYTRKWQPDALPESATVSADAALYLSEWSESDPRVFDLATDSTEAAQIAARITLDGPIVDTVTLFPIVDYSSIFRGSLKVLDTFTDGTQFVEFTIALGGDLPEGFNIIIEPYKAGVIFDDGTLERVITAADLDDLGRYRYRMLLPADVPGSACNFYQLQQADSAIGKKI